MYPVISEPPLLDGALKLITAVLFTVEVATTSIGASGIDEGITPVEVADATELPFAFVAITVNVYDVPFVKPDTVIGELVPVTIVPLDAVTV